MISLIAAIDEKRGIGKNGKLPWYIPEDLKHFKELTSNHTVIMGRKTFESIRKPLPDRKNIIITRNFQYPISNIQYPDLIFVNSLEEALRQAQGKLGSEVFIIGGGQIFNEAISIADKLYLTLVEGDYNADTFFPDYSEFTKETFIGAGQVGEYKYKFLELQK